MLCRILFRSIFAFLLVFTLVLAASARAPKKILVVTVTKGFRHSDSIPVAEKIIQTLGDSKEGGWTTDYVRTDEDMTQKMTAVALKQYDAVVFVSTTGNLPLPDKQAFLDYVASGKGFVGFHAAADTFHDFAPYIEMIGGEFKTHGAQVEVECLNEDKKHPSTKSLDDSTRVFDEIYQFKNFDRTKFHGLLRLDKHPNDKTPGDYPIAWCKMYTKGKVFYSALGHRVDVWEKPWFQDHVRGGIRWALGLEKGDSKPQPLSSTMVSPAK